MTSRTTLNRSNSLLRGTVTWFPLQGDGNNYGDNGGSIVLPSGLTFDSNGDSSNCPAGDATTKSSTLTASLMGIDGAKARTVFFKYRHEDNGANWTLFGLGGTTSVTGGDFSVMKSGYNGITLSGWSDDLGFNDSLGYTDHDITVVITVDTSGNIKGYSRSVSLADGSVATANGTGGGTPFATPTSAPLYYGYTPVQGAGSPQANSRRFWFGILGGTVWSDTEAASFLVNPDQIWTATVASARAPFMISG